MRAVTCRFWDTEFLETRLRPGRPARDRNEGRAGKSLAL